jgi:hypothetical protein
MAELYRYAAFISYSSKDAPFARRLHRALESYGIPASLGSFNLIGGGKRNRIYPVFRDREELLRWSTKPALIARNHAFRPPSAATRSQAINSNPLRPMRVKERTVSVMRG